MTLPEKVQPTALLEKVQPMTLLEKVQLTTLLEKIPVKQFPALQIVIIVKMEYVNVEMKILVQGYQTHVSPDNVFAGEPSLVI